MFKPVSLFTLSAAVIVAAWWWLGASVAMPPSPLAPGEKLYCVSYAPFRGSQTPLDLSTHISADQIDQDLERLAKVTDCVRTYSVDFGLDQVPELAKRHGLKVLLGLWVSGHADRTQYQISTGIRLANAFPDVIRAVVIGNEALLRGEVSPSALGDIIRSVKSRIKAPVTYADVWEFWLRYRELASAVDFVTIHILPYWEDDPVAANAGADHVDTIRRNVAAYFPGKEVMIGEVGWPSAGRMRQGALPSPANQARVLADVLERGRQEHFRVNLIEAFDQPWKRALEGTVGGHWGLLDDATREPKFLWGQPVSNHPYWPWQAAGGVVFAMVVFAAAFHRRTVASESPTALIAVSANAVVAGVLVGWALENLPVESLWIGDWIKGIAFIALAIAAPIVCSIAQVAVASPTSFDRVLGRSPDRERNTVPWALGLLLIVLAVLSIQSALSLAFDPRYRDFPFAPLTAAATPFLVLSLTVWRPEGIRGLAETTAGALLIACAVFIVWNETLANWQALWFAGAAIAAAVSLLRVRVVPG